MSGINSKEFAELALDGSNYLTWAMDAKLSLTSMSLSHTINQPAAGTNGPSAATSGKTPYSPGLVGALVPVPQPGLANRD